MLMMIPAMMMVAATVALDSASAALASADRFKPPLNADQRQTLFEVASKKGDEATDRLLEIVSATYNSRAEANILANERTDEGGESVLHLACIWGGPRKVRGLLAAGADPNARSSKQESGLDMTPLTWCCYAGYTDEVKEFLSDPRTDVNLVVRTEAGGFMTALDIANKIAGGGHPSGETLVTLLKEHGAHTYSDLKAMSFGGEEIPGMPPARKMKKK